MKKQKQQMYTPKRKTMKKLILLGGLSMLSMLSFGQRIYAPNGAIGTVTNGSNSVGIGTNSPISTAVLDVNGYSYFRSSMGVKTTPSNLYAVTAKQTVASFFANYNPIGIFSGLNFNGQKMTSISVSNTGSPYFNLYNNIGTIEMVNLNSNGTSFLNGGNLGIGTSTPQAKLDIKGTTLIGDGTFIQNKTNAQGIAYNLYVKGGIITEEMKVELAAGNWADYVFDADYELKTLEEVEEQILETGHLHNIASAKEIEEEGLELRSMTINQQEKIEEIYLHLIELNKKIEKLKEENTSLKKEVKQLSK